MQFAKALTNLLKWNKTIERQMNFSTKNSAGHRFNRSKGKFKIIFSFIQQNAYKLTKEECNNSRRNT